MSLLTTLSSSSFFLDKYLNKIINDNNYKTAQFSYALKNNIIAARQVSASKSELGSLDWLVLNRKLVKSQKSAVLALAYWSSILSMLLLISAS